MENRRMMQRSNPWWREKKNIERDKKIKEWEKSSTRYDPRLRHETEYDFEADNTVVYTLRGIRQVGKSTMIKLQIRDLLERGVHPWNIFYYSFDLTDSRMQMVDIIEGYQQLAKGHQKKSERTYLFLDEVSGINNWQKGIKWLVDENVLENCTVLATGSQAANIIHATERLPGRRGRTKDARDRVLMPMKFSEFVGCQNSEIGEFIKGHDLADAADRRHMLMQLASKEIPTEMDMLYDRFVYDLDGYLDEYLRSGGIPKVVNEKIKTGFIRPQLYHDYLDGIKSDWVPIGPVDLLRQFSHAIIEGMGSSTSWNSLRKSAELSRWATTQEYALALKDLSVAIMVYRYDYKRKRPWMVKEKKIYLHDPFYVHMFRSWDGMTDPFDSAEDYLSDSMRCSSMAEGVVASHLGRLAWDITKNKHEFNSANSVFFWKDGQNREVDFVMCPERAVEIPIEVKYRKSVDHRELGGLAGFLSETGTKSGIVLSKTQMEERRDYLVMPVSVFLMLA